MRFPVSAKSGQSFSPLEKKKIVLYLSVRVFSTKVLIGDTIFTSPTGDGTLPDYPFAGQRQYLHFSAIFKTLSIGPVPGNEPENSRSTVKPSTD